MSNSRVNFVLQSTFLARLHCAACELPQPIPKAGLNELTPKANHVHAGLGHDSSRQKPCDSNATCVLRSDTSLVCFQHHPITLPGRTHASASQPSCPSARLERGLPPHAPQVMQTANVAGCTTVRLQHGAFPATFWASSAPWSVRFTPVSRLATKYDGDIPRRMVSTWLPRGRRCPDQVKPSSTSAQELPGPSKPFAIAGDTTVVWKGATAPHQQRTASRDWSWKAARSGIEDTVTATTAEHQWQGAATQPRVHTLAAYKPGRKANPNRISVPQGRPDPHPRSDSDCRKGNDAPEDHIASAMETHATKLGEVLRTERSTAPRAMSTHPAKDKPLVNDVADLLAQARAAAQSGDGRLRRRVASRLIAELSHAATTVDDCAAAGSDAGNTAKSSVLSSSAAVELAVLCPDLSLTNEAVWGVLLGRAAALVRELDAWAMNSSSTEMAIQGLTGPRPREQRCAGVLMAWHLALVVRAATVCGQVHLPQLHTIQHALSMWVEHSLLQLPQVRRVQDGAAVLHSSQHQGQTLAQGPAGDDWECDIGTQGLEALLCASREMPSLPPYSLLKPGQPAQEYDGDLGRQPPAAMDPVEHMLAFVAQPKVAAAALRELLDQALPSSYTIDGASDPTHQPGPYCPQALALMTSSLGAAASLRVALVAWQLLQSAEQPQWHAGKAAKPGQHLAASASAAAIAVEQSLSTSPTIATLIGSRLSVAQQEVEHREELLERLALLVQQRAKQLLPEARVGSRSSSNNNDSGGGSSSMRAVQKLSLAWKSSPYLQRYPGLSKAIWEALRGSVVEAPTGASTGPGIATLSPSAAGGWSLGTITNASTALPLFLSELCRLAAATFYTRGDAFDASSSAVGSSSGSYNPNAHDLLLLIRTAGLLREQAEATVVAAAPGPGWEHLTARMEAVRSLEAIAMASASAHLRRVTGLQSATSTAPASAAVEGKEDVDHNNQAEARQREPKRDVGRVQAVTPRKTLSSVPTPGGTWLKPVGESEAAISGDCGSSTLAVHSGGGSPDSLTLPTSVLLTEQLAKRSRIPDWHLIWRLVRRHNIMALAEAGHETETVGTKLPLSLQPDVDQQQGAKKAPAWVSQAAVAVSERVLSSSGVDLQRWCWPQTAIRLADALGESLWVAMPDSGVAAAAAATAAGIKGAASSAEAAYDGGPLSVTKAGVERLLLHAAPAVLGAPEAHLVTSLGWLRSAAVLEGCRHRGRNCDNSSAGAMDTVLTRMADEVTSSTAAEGQHGGNGMSVVHADMAASSTALLQHLRRRLQQPMRQQASSCDATAALDPALANVVAGDVLGGHGDSSGRSVDAEIEAVGQLLHTAAQLPEGYLPDTLMDACLEVVVAAVQTDPWVMGRCVAFHPSIDVADDRRLRHQSDGGVCISDVVVQAAAVKALRWLAAQQMLQADHVVLPLLTVVSSALAVSGKVGAAAEKQCERVCQAADRNAGPRPGPGPRQKQRRHQTSGQVKQQRELAVATFSVARLAEMAAEEGAEIAPQLHEAARRLAGDLLRTPADRMPLPQLVGLCGALWRLGLLDIQLLLHLTQIQRHHAGQQLSPLCTEASEPSMIYAFDAYGKGGYGRARSAVATSELLPLAAAVLKLNSQVPRPRLGLELDSVAAVSVPPPPGAGSQVEGAAASLGNWLSPLLSRDVAAVPTDQLVAALVAAHELAALSGRSPDGNVGSAVRSSYAAAEGWLEELWAAATRRLLVTGVDNLLLHQLASLARGLTLLPPSPALPLRPGCDRTLQVNRHTGIRGARSREAPWVDAADAGPMVYVQAPEETWLKGEQQASRWLPRWLRPQRPQLRAAAQPEPVGGVTPAQDVLSFMVENKGQVAAVPTRGSVAQLPKAAHRHVHWGDGDQRQEEVPHLTPAAYRDRQLQQVEGWRQLAQLVRKELMWRTTHHGDAYEAPADVACRALRDLAVAGELRGSPQLAALLTDGLVFRLADDTGVDGLADVAAAVSAGPTDPWVAHCASRGLLAELASGLQRRLRLQAESFTIEHLMAIATDMYCVAMATGSNRSDGGFPAYTGSGSEGAASAIAALPGCGAALRVLGSALAARAEQLTPDQALSVAAMFSPPKLRDTYLLQRLTAAAAVTFTAVPAEAPHQPYTVEQLLQLSQVMFRSGLREPQMFAPLAGAMRVAADAVVSGLHLAGAISSKSERSDGGGAGMDGRTLQAAATLLRAVRLNTDADALQRAFVQQLRGHPGPRA